MSIIKNYPDAQGPIRVPVRMANQQGNGGNNPGLPRQRPPVESTPFGKPRDVTCTLPFWLNMPISFTSSAGEQQQGATKGENFDLNVRGAWTNLVSPRVQFSSTQTGSTWSTQQVPLRSLAGATELAHPMTYWRRGFHLGENNTINGVFTNDGGEAAGNVVFYTERTENNLIVTVKRTETYWLLIDLGLRGSGGTGTGQPQSAPIEYPLFIYGALCSAESFKVRLFDTSNNYGWSTDQLPIGAFSGIQADGNPQPIMYYPFPYYLRPNATIRAEWLNVANETGGYLAFVCEKVLG